MAKRKYFVNFLIIPLAALLTVAGIKRLVRGPFEPHEMMSYTLRAEPEAGTIAVELPGITLVFEGLHSYMRGERALVNQGDFPVSGTSEQFGSYYAYSKGKPPFLFSHSYQNGIATISIWDKHRFQVKDRGKTVVCCGQTLPLGSGPEMVGVSEDGTVRVIRGKSPDEHTPPSTRAATPETNR